MEVTRKLLLWKLVFIVLGIQFCIQRDWRKAEHRAGPSATDETCYAYTAKKNQHAVHLSEKVFYRKT